MSMTFLTSLGVTGILCSSRLFPVEKAGKGIPESSRLEFINMFLANNSALLDAEDNTSGPLNKGSIADVSLFRTPLAICQKSREPHFWEMIDSFVSLGLARLEAPRTLLQRILVCLNFTLNTDLFC